MFPIPRGMHTQRCPTPSPVRAFSDPPHSALLVPAHDGEPIRIGGSSNASRAGQQRTDRRSRLTSGGPFRVPGAASARRHLASRWGKIMGHSGERAARKFTGKAGGMPWTGVIWRATLGERGRFSCPWYGRRRRTSVILVTLSQKFLCGWRRTS
jgi:hypothetical protein